MIVGRTWPLSLFREFGWFRGSEGSLSDNILSQGVFCRCVGNLGGLRGLRVAGRLCLIVGLILPLYRQCLIVGRIHCMPLYRNA